MGTWSPRRTARRGPRWSTGFSALWSAGTWRLARRRPDACYAGSKALLPPGRSSLRRAIAPRQKAVVEERARERMTALVLPSGCKVDVPEERLLRFFGEEHIYYDGVPSDEPDAVTPLDVLVTVAVNSFVNNAAKVRRIHRGLAAACNPLLPPIAPEASLLDAEPPRAEVGALLEAAVQVPEVLVPVATKVLHRKRPALILMLDDVVSTYYLAALGRSTLRGRTQDKRHAASVAMIVLEAFRDDLLAVSVDVERLRSRLADAGFPVSAVRLMEVLIWTQVEPRGYYLDAVGPSPV